MNIAPSAINPDDFNFSKSGLSDNDSLPSQGRSATNNERLTNEQIAADIAIRAYQEKFVELRRAQKLVIELKHATRRDWDMLPALAKKMIGTPRGYEGRLMTVPQVDNLADVSCKQALIWVLARYACDRFIDFPTVLRQMIVHGYKSGSVEPKRAAQSALCSLAEDGRVLKQMYVGKVVYRLGPGIRLEPTDSPSN